MRFVSQVSSAYTLDCRICIFDKFNFTVCAIRKLPMQKIQNEILKFQHENHGFLHVCNSAKSFAKSFAKSAGHLAAGLLTTTLSGYDAYDGSY